MSAQKAARTVSSSRSWPLGSFTMSTIAVSAEPNIALTTVSMPSGKPRGPVPNTAARRRLGCAAASPPHVCAST
eukprot:7184893-Prymnesium_polylepis.1